MEVTGSVLFIDKPLEQYQEEQIALIKQAFEAAVKTGYTTSIISSITNQPITVNSAPTDIMNFQGAYQLATAANLTNVTICDFYNQIQPITVAQLQTIIVELLANISKLYAKKWQLRNEILAQTTPEGVLSITW
jgi:isopropylmalate/homocitrate/citramalate synthase